MNSDNNIDSWDDESSTYSIHDITEQKVRFNPIPEIYNDSNSDANSTDISSEDYWFDDPLDWVNKRDVGENVKEYTKNWEKHEEIVHNALERINNKLGSDGARSKLIWDIKELKDNVLKMKRIYEVVNDEIKQEKNHKIMHMPQDKFYGRILFIIEFIASTSVLADIIYRTTSNGKIQWYDAMLFAISYITAKISAWVNQRWGEKERKLRQLYKIKDKYEYLESIKNTIDILDFNDDFIGKVKHRLNSGLDKHSINTIRKMIQEDYYIDKCKIDDIPTEFKQFIDTDKLEEEIKKRDRERKIYLEDEIV